jgi:hypothetical protein
MLGKERKGKDSDNLVHREHMNSAVASHLEEKKLGLSPLCLRMLCDKRSGGGAKSSS